MIDTLISTFAGTGTSAIIGLLHNWQSNKHEFMLASQKQNLDAIKSARESKNTKLWDTILIVTIITTVYFFVFPMGAAFYNIPMYVSFEETHGSIISIFRGEASIVWKSFPPGYIITPIHSYIMSSASTFCFLRLGK